jgi:HEAT repeat protein
MSTSVIHTDKIDSLIADLASDQWATRQHARQALVAMGSPAATALIKTLQDRDWHVRWGAAKTLGQINDPAVPPALVRMLEDERSGIRWLAAEGLMGHGREGLVALLQALVHHSDDLWLREGAHHVIHNLAERDKYLHDLLRPVLVAIDDIEPAIQVPPAAQAALDTLAKATSQQDDRG